jgi:hypothetical protein
VSTLGRPLPDLASPQIRFSEAKGLGYELGVCRRDPSDILKIGDTHFVWYTKVRPGPGVFQYPSGYSGAIWYASSKDGVNWREEGEALSRGGAGAWDEQGVWTPNMLLAGGRFFMFYCGAQAPFSARSSVHYGLAVSDSPRGPWRKLDNNPVLSPSRDPDAFDSFRVDGAAAIFRDSKYWLYYKGRQHGLGPSHTRWGLAIAAEPAGPYVKTKENPVTDSGHEVLVWPQGSGVAAMITLSEPRANSILWAPDGVHFQFMSDFFSPVKAPKAFCPEAFTQARPAPGFRWGISMVDGPHPFLTLFHIAFAGGRD